MNIVFGGPGEHMLPDTADSEREKLAGDCADELMKDAGEDGGANARPPCVEGHP